MDEAAGGVESAKSNSNTKNATKMFIPKVVWKIWSKCFKYLLSKIAISILSVSSSGISDLYAWKWATFPLRKMVNGKITCNSSIKVIIKLYVTEWGNLIGCTKIMHINDLCHKRLNITTLTLYGVCVGFPYQFAI